MNTMTLNYAQGGLAAADRVRSLGRNEDTQLVHMTPGEVQALQHMAEQHGGSLTINPHTGLPEAGFLGSVLKVAAPAALSYFAGPALGSALLPGASAAMQAGIGAGLIAGGLTTLQTGNIGAGLTSGLISGGLAGVAKGWDPTASSTAGAATTTVGKSATTEAAKAAATAQAEQAANTAVNTGLNVAGTYNPALSSAATTAAAQAPEAGGLAGWWKGLSTPAKLGIGAGGLGLLGAMAEQPGIKNVAEDKGTIRPYTYTTARRAPEPGRTQYVQQAYDAAGNPVLDTAERNYYTQSYTALPTYKAAAGGLMGIGSMDQNNMYPQSQQEHTNFATPTQMPTSAEVIGADYDAATNPYTGQAFASGGPISRDEAYASAAQNQYKYDPDTQQYTHIEPPPPPPAPKSISRLGVLGFNQPYMGMGGMNQGYSGMGGLGFMGNMIRQAKTPAAPKLPQYTYDPETQEYTLLAEGGLTDLGSYSDGGRLLKGPGDGVSDDIPAVIGKHQPARLADGEFVIPARIVSELGNGSTDAGAKRLYAMMDRIQKGRQKTVGKDKVAVDSKAEKHLPA